MISDLKFETVKVASFDCASHRLIEEITKFDFKHIIVSTVRIIVKLKKQRLY